MANTRGRLAESFKPSWLALIPLISGALIGFVLLPKRADIVDVPVPRVDTRAVSAVVERDDAEAKRAAFPDDIRYLGSKVRDFHRLGWEIERAHREKAKDEVELELNERIGPLRTDIDRSVTSLLHAGRIADLHALRSYQLMHFLRELERFESDGHESDELIDVSGTLVERLRSVGWCDDHTVLLDDDARRVAYKGSWNAILGLDAHPDMALTLDEQRVRARFELLHPVPDRASRGAAQSLRQAGKEKEADAYTARSIDVYRLERVERLEKIDPAYPAQFARMILEHRLGHADKARRAQQAWAALHPEGDYALRARNLSVAMLADEVVR